ncbi:MAG: hypothetical protein IPG32_13595 [Saprospirales bacterium]|nr:hypothetical protein [Saprospirales bacterium]
MPDRSPLFPSRSQRFFARKLQGVLHRIVLLPLDELREGLVYEYRSTGDTSTLLSTGTTAAMRPTRLPSSPACTTT